MPEDEDSGNGSENTDEKAAANAAKDKQDDPRISQARSEAIEERKKRQELEAKLKTIEDSQLSETEKQSARLKELEESNQKHQQTIKELRTSGEISVAALKARARYPDDIPKLLDLSKVKYDDDGNPTNAEDLVAKLQAKRPELFGGNGSADGGVRGQSTSGATDMNELIRQGARR